MANFLAELKRRNVYRVGALYAVVAWVLLQLTANVAPILDLPPWIARTVLLLLVVGFPVALVFAWVHQLSPESGGLARVPTGKLDWFLAGALVVVIALVSYQQLAPTTVARTGQQASIANGSTSTGAISIAVLPFANMSGDAGQEFFSDGMTEEINAALAKVPDLQIVARTSAFEFKDQNRNVRAVGEALGATHVIEGSVRKAGARVRITAQLVRADSGLQLWSESYDRELTDIFAIQEDIAQAIAAALRVPLGLQQGDTLVRNRTSDLESYQQYLHARALVRARGAGVSEGVAILESVVARDPNYAPAWALLAQAYALLPQYQSPVLRSGSVEEARRSQLSSLDKGEKAAREAIRLDPRHAGGYAALGYVQYNLGKWAAGDDLFKQALTLDANDPEILHFYSLTLAVEGRLKDSLTIRERLLTLEPFVPIYKLTTALIMQMNGQSQATIPILEPIPPDAAGGFQRNARLAVAYAAAGRYSDAADTLLLTTGNLVSRKSVEDAARLLRRAPAKAVEPLPNLEDELNFVYAYVGAPNLVLDAAERFVEVGFLTSNIGRSVWLPLHAPVRKTERFKALVRKEGLVDYWRAKGWSDLCRPQGADDFVCD